jgi:nicotinamidase-related amidase
MGRTALCIVDVLNTYDHEDADKLLENVPGTIEPILDLRERADLVVQVNDNWGGWHADRRRLIDTALGGEHPELVEPLLPREDDLLVIKGRHSVFFQTPMDYIVHQHEVERLVLVGQVTEQCILYSALDAHLRHLPVAIPTDAVAHIWDDLADASLRMMERNMRAELRPAAEVTF